MGRWTRTLLVIMAVMVGLLLIAAFSFPSLAIDRPIGARNAVLEGWIDTAHVPEVRRLAERYGIEHLYITGTSRNFSYTLRFGDTLFVELTEPVTGELIVSACGGKNAGFVLLGDNAPLISDAVTEKCRERAVSVATPVHSLLITPSFIGKPEPAWEVLFLLYLRVNGTNLHELQRSVAIHRADGSRVLGTPTYAELFGQALERAGMPSHRIIVLPSNQPGKSRTWTNAQRFARQARKDGIRMIDVISFGIHARRSRATYQAACGKDVQVGVHCIEDPELQRGRWWLNWTGWVKLLKELAGVPAASLVDSGGAGMM